MVNGQRITCDADATMAKNTLARVENDVFRDDFVGKCHRIFLFFRVIFADQLKEPAFSFRGATAASKIMAVQHQRQYFPAKLADTLALRFVNMAAFDRVLATWNETPGRIIPHGAHRAMRLFVDAFEMT